MFATHSPTHHAPSTDASAHRPLPPRPWRGTKIVATLGPASTNLDDVVELARAGVDVFRLNFSHGTHNDHQLRWQWVRAAEARVGRPLGVLLDLQGPKLRVGRLIEPILLTEGTELELVFGKQQTQKGDPVPVPHAEVFSALEVGHHILVDDGKLRLRVIHVHSLGVRVRSETAGRLQERKGLNLPDSLLPMQALTPKDLQDLAFGLALGVEWVALSFVQTEADVLELSDLVQGRAGLIAKIEKPSAVERLEAILHASDAVMIARGDLGVELPPEDVPGVQRRIAQLAREMGKPVIVATQMLESMIEASTPTRAEASDVATAVYDGVDAVMLSAESASGRYPVEAVRMMARIIERVESDPRQQRLMASVMTHTRARTQANATDAISAAVRVVAQTVQLSATVTYTSSGASALRVAHERPRTPLIGLTPNEHTARRLALVWGVRPVVSRDAANVDDMVALATDAVNQLCPKTLAASERAFAIVAGMPFGTPGATNMLRLVTPTTTRSAANANANATATAAAPAKVAMKNAYFATPD
jgi:pyruvate kinase